MYIKNIGTSYWGNQISTIFVINLTKRAILDENLKKLVNMEG